jgi:hypothetical protein
MSDGWLAQERMADWLEWLVPMVVIALAVLGNITRALTKSKARKEEKRSGPRPEDHRRHHPPAPPRPVARPAPVRPVARPIPSHERPRPAVTAPAPPRRAQPHRVDSLPDLLKEVFGQLREAASASPAPASKPAPPSPPVESTPTPPRPRKARRRKLLATANRASTPPAAPKPAELRDHHLRHLEDSFATVTEPEIDEFAIAADEIGSLRLGVRRPGRTDLRRAVILSEVLSPPLSLRDPDDAWG